MRSNFDFLLRINSHVRWKLMTVRKLWWQLLPEISAVPFQTVNRPKKKRMLKLKRRQMKAKQQLRSSTPTSTNPRSVIRFCSSVMLIFSQINFLYRNWIFSDRALSSPQMTIWIWCWMPQNISPEMKHWWVFVQEVVFQGLLHVYWTCRNRLNSSIKLRKSNCFHNWKKFSSVWTVYSILQEIKVSKKLFYRRKCKRKFSSFVKKNGRHAAN